MGGQRPHLTLTASVETLARMPGSKAADLEWGQPVSGEFLRRVACDCELTCVLVDEGGDPLSVGRTSRTFTAAQRRALAARDRGCVLCGRPAAWCESHHLVHWIDGGETSVEKRGAGLQPLPSPAARRRLPAGARAGPDLDRDPRPTATLT